ncbi:MAG: hypothetical protein AABY30_02160, partial [Candidatus Thermoplasmatota archaeon]
MDFRDLWEKFRKTAYFRLLYLFLVASLVVAVTVTLLFLGCLIILVVPVVMLLVPHYFGERRIRNHVVNGLAVVIFATVLYAAIATPDLMSRPPTELAADGARADLSGGFVTPFLGDEGASFNFTVNVTSTDPDRGNFTVQVLLIDHEGLGATLRTVRMEAAEDGDPADGEEYYANVTLRPVFHSFNFQVLGVVNSTEAVLAETPLSVGPFNAPSEAYLSVLWLRVVYFMVVFYGTPFFLFLMIYWWIAKAKHVRGAQPPKEKK